MNSKRINSIFESSNTISREEINIYRETKDEKLKHSIEKKSMTSDFDTDALEGWANSKSGLPLLNTLDKRFTKKRVSLKFKLIVGFTLFLITITSIYFQNTQSIKPIISKSPLSKRIDSIEKSDVILPVEIQQMKEVSVNNQIPIKTIQKDFRIQQSKQLPELSIELEKNNIDILPINKINREKADISLVKNQLFGKEIFLYDLKLIDYRAYRSKPTIKSKQLIMNSTPANKEDKYSKEEFEDESSWKIIDIPYIEYIEKSMEIFATGNDKKALSRFEIILNTYPTDINANFYGGLCYFNLGEYKKAQIIFEKCINSEFINFSEEVDWYLAKSYLANNEKEKAKVILNKIQSQKGYYSKQATQLILDF